MRIATLMIAAAVTFCGVPTAFALDICKGEALEDLGTVEEPGDQPNTSYYVLKKGEVDEAITQYNVNTVTHEATVCSHGGYCFPAKVKRYGKPVTVLRLTNCVLSKSYSHIEGDANDVVTYSLEPDSSANLPGPMKAYMLSKQLQEMGSIQILADSAADAMVHHPNSACADLGRKALAGDQNVLSQFRDGSDEICTQPAGGSPSGHGASVASEHGGEDGQPSEVPDSSGMPPSGLSTPGTEASGGASRSSSWSQDDETALYQGWWVIAASVPLTKDPMMLKRSDIVGRAKRCGFELYNDTSNKFLGFVGGYEVYVLGAYSTKAESLVIRKALLPCIRDAYVKYGTYAGE